MNPDREFILVSDGVLEEVHFLGDEDELKMAALALRQHGLSFAPAYIGNPNGAFEATGGAVYAHGATGPLPEKEDEPLELTGVDELMLAAMAEDQKDGPPSVPSLRWQIHEVAQLLDLEGMANAMHQTEWCERMGQQYLMGMRDAFWCVAMNQEANRGNED